MGNQSSVKKINYEDVTYIIKQRNFLLINTLHVNNQQCLIKNTINIADEVGIINDNMNNLSINIVIYGDNCNCENIYKKYSQLLGLGFHNAYVYTGGLFEWLCLQDIYGNDLFPTTSRELDILKYKPKSLLMTLAVSI